MPIDAPGLTDLQRTAAVFNGFPNVDRSWLRLVDQTAPAVDLSRAEHRALLLRWLNSWGCRIRYPREGEPAPFDDGVADWWDRWGPALPAADLAALDDDEIALLGDAYAGLAAVAVSAGPVRRSLGPTAAAKALYALRPNAIMPWDAAIAAALHGGRDGPAFAAHQRLGRQWALAVLAETGIEERRLAALVGRPQISLAKILDEYLYVRVTMSAAATPKG
ncbi:hypothetical protein [Dactylosporangium sp. CA-139066]|uniref:hypothetical protein n=1 Tax=Dactylosporangium sp. CA-139066 TaxID=3239930 RepID=UPI003D8D3B69